MLGIFAGQPASGSNYRAATATARRRYPLLIKKESGALVAHNVGDLDRLDRDKIYVNPITRCWEWTAAKTKDGYGQARRNGKNVKAHRHVYQTLVGPLASGVQQLDHLCRVRHCVNPDHLDPVTPLENVRRGLPVVSAPLPDDIQLSIVRAIEETYKRGVLDGMRRALSTRQ